MQNTLMVRFSLAISNLLQQIGLLKNFWELCDTSYILILEQTFGIPFMNKMPWELIYLKFSYGCHISFTSRLINFIAWQWILPNT